MLSLISLYSIANCYTYNGCDIIINNFKNTYTAHDIINITWNPDEFSSNEVTVTLNSNYFTPRRENCYYPYSPLTISGGERLLLETIPNNGHYIWNVPNYNYLNYENVS